MPKNAGDLYNLCLLSMNKEAKKHLKACFREVVYWIKIWKQQDLADCLPYLENTFNMCELLPQWTYTLRLEAPTLNLRMKNLKVLRDLFPNIECQKLLNYIPFELKNTEKDDLQKLKIALLEKKKIEQEEMRRIQLKEKAILKRMLNNYTKMMNSQESSQQSKSPLFNYKS